MHDVMESVLNNCLSPTNEMILNVIEIETSLINTNHPDFIGSADSLLNLFADQDAKSETLSEQEDGVGEAKTFSLLDKEKKEQENI